MIIGQNLKLGRQGWLFHNNGNATVRAGHLQPAVIQILCIRFEISRIEALEVVAAELADLVYNLILPTHVMSGIAVAIQLRAEVLPVLRHAGGLGGDYAITLMIKRCLILAAGPIECRHTRGDSGKGQVPHFPERVDRDHLIQGPGRCDSRAGIRDSCLPIRCLSVLFNRWIELPCLHYADSLEPEIEETLTMALGRTTSGSFAGQIFRVRRVDHSSR